MRLRRWWLGIISGLLESEFWSLRNVMMEFVNVIVLMKILINNLLWWISILFFKGLMFVLILFEILISIVVRLIKLWSIVMSFGMVVIVMWVVVMVLIRIFGMIVVNRIRNFFIVLEVFEKIELIFWNVLIVVSVVMMMVIVILRILSRFLCWVVFCCESLFKFMMNRMFVIR